MFAATCVLSVAGEPPSACRSPTNATHSPTARAHHAHDNAPSVDTSKPRGKDPSLHDRQIQTCELNLPKIQMATSQGALKAIYHHRHQ
jgi:hypothetical protein